MEKGGDGAPTVCNHAGAVTPVRVATPSTPSCPENCRCVDHHTQNTQRLSLTALDDADAGHRPKQVDAAAHQQAHTGSCRDKGRRRMQSKTKLECHCHGPSAASVPLAAAENIGSSRRGGRQFSALLCADSATASNPLLHHCRWRLRGKGQQQQGGRGQQQQGGKMLGVARRRGMC